MYIYIYRYVYLYIYMYTYTRVCIYVSSMEVKDETWFFPLKLP